MRNYAESRISVYLQMPLAVPAQKQCRTPPIPLPKTKGSCFVPSFYLILSNFLLAQPKNVLHSLYVGYNHFVFGASGLLGCRAA